VALVQELLPSVKGRGKRKQPGNLELSGWKARGCCLDLPGPARTCSGFIAHYRHSRPAPLEDQVLRFYDRQRGTLRMS
jgi:hypothetical protein